MQFKIIFIQSKLTCSQKSNPIHPNLQHRFGTSFTFSLLRHFFALSPYQTWIKNKTPQTPSFTSLPEWAFNSELSERIRPQKCTDAFETGCWHWRQPSTSCFVPCFPPMLLHKLNVDKLFQLKSSFFNSSTAFSTPFLLFQLQSSFFNYNPAFNPEWLKLRQNSEMILLLTSFFLYHNSIVNHWFDHFKQRHHHLDLKYVAPPTLLWSTISLCFWGYTLNTIDL